MSTINRTLRSQYASKYQRKWTGCRPTSEIRTSSKNSFAASIPTSTSRTSARLARICSDQYLTAVAIYSIKDLEKLSGIKAHTLRIWEQRYGLIVPKRTATNIRYYDDDELRALMNIALLNKNGYKISHIARLSRDQIADRAAAVSVNNFAFDTQSDSLTIAMIEMDEYRIDRIINTNIQQVGFETTMLEVIFPFLDKLGLLWLTGSISPAHEHFITALIRQKIISVIDNEPLPTGKDTKRFLLFLPEGEHQELSLLFMQYLLKSRRHAVLYLGLGIGVNDLQDAYLIRKPDYIFTIISESFQRQPVQQYVDVLSGLFPDSCILMTGQQMVHQQVQERANVRILKSLDDTIHFLDQMPAVSYKKGYIPL